jgi:hypothetical protein
MSDSDSDTDTTDSDTDTTDSDSGGGGTSGMGLDPDSEPDEETKEAIEKERQERLDPENRPENAEVDNTPRDFDVTRGQFTDSEEYDESEPPPFSDPEDPNNPDNQES